MKSPSHVHLIKSDDNRCDHSNILGLTEPPLPNLYWVRCISRGNQHVLNKKLAIAWIPDKTRTWAFVDHILLNALLYYTTKTCTPNLMDTYIISNHWLNQPLLFVLAVGYMCSNLQYVYQYGNTAFPVIIKLGIGKQTNP